MGKKVLFGTVLLAVVVMGGLVSVWLVLPSQASTASGPLEVEWERWYGGAGTEWCRSVQQTSDGGYILAGHTLSFGTVEYGESDFWLVKTNRAGSMQWNRTFGVAEISDIAYSVKQTRDGGYIVAGTGGIGGRGYEACLVKTSSTGVTEWIQALDYRENPAGSAGGDARSVLQTSDGGYVFAGFAYPNGSIRDQFWLVKTNAVGIIMWNQTYGGEGYERAYSVQQTRDGGYIIAGSGSEPYSYADFMLVKANATGSMEWSQTYGGTGTEEAYYVQQTRDGGYIVTGAKLGSNGAYEDWVVKTNSTGAMQWSKTYGGNIDRLDSVLQTSDGGFLFAGSGNSGWLVKTNTVGEVEWNQSCSSVPKSMEKTRDGGYIVGGFGGSWPGDFYLMKLRGNDADEDGLLDNWEKYGIDSDDDGLVDLDLPGLGADWRHKDLFVEVDYMATHHRPDSDAMNDVVAAFANAPIDNPDSLPGIKLHVDIDDQIPHQDIIKAFYDFDTIKSDYFGTAAQRSSANSSRILDAKKLAYRYCLFVHQYSKWNSTHWAPTLSAGIAEFPGNDFLVALGGGAGGTGTRDQQATVFMHELGHNLNLDHGGGDDINYKPNYLSIMNYAFQWTHLVGWRPLDYSRRELPALQEGALNEPAGIQGSGFWLYTVWNNSRQVYKRGTTFGALDWNGDGNFSYLVQANINNFPGWDYPSPSMELLEGYDDWANVKLAFGDTVNFAEGAHMQLADPELSWETVEAMRVAVLAVHDVAVFNVTSPLDVWSPGNSLTVNVTLGNLGGSDENVTVVVYANGTVVSSSSLVIKAGNLTKVTLPYAGQALIPGTYTLKATVSQVAGETYTADNTVTGGTITVTDAIPEFSPVIILTTALLLTGVAAAAIKTSKKSSKR